MSKVNEDKAYEKLIKRFPLRPIRDDKHNDLAAEVCDMLLDKGDALRACERDYLEVLTDLIIKYESKWDDDLDDVSPRDLIKFLMEQNGLAQKDLVSEFGSPSRVSEFLNGERRLSLEQAKRLAHRFRVKVDSLLADSKDDFSNTHRTFTSGANLSSSYVDSRLSLTGLFKHKRPVSYETVFFMCINLVYEKKDNYVLELLKSPIEKNATFSTIYCRFFNAINLLLIVTESAKNSTDELIVSENIDIDRYMAFVRPEYMDWERKIRKHSSSKKWLRAHHVSTYADFFKALYSLGENSLNSNPRFWERCIGPREGQAGFERFVIDLYEEIAPFTRESRSPVD